MGSVNFNITPTFWMKVIIFSTRSDYVKTSYSAAFKMKDVKYYSTNIIALYNRICGMLHLKPLRICYKLLYFLVLLRNGWKENKIVIYHGLGTRYLIDDGFLDFVNTQKVKSYHIYIMWDIFDFERLQDLDSIRSKVNEIIIPDSIVAEKYKVSFYPLFYSKERNIPYGDKASQIVFFCGEDGGRLELLKKIAKHFLNHDIQYDFYCSNSNEIFTDEYGIKHIKRMAHEEYIKHVANCSVLLDIVKPGSTCCTLRFCEAVLYNTRLLSNNLTITSMESFNSENMKLFDKCEDIDLNFVRSTGQVEYGCVDSVSPVTFINSYKIKVRNLLR